MVNKKTNTFDRLIIVLIANVVSVTVCLLGLVVISYAVLKQTIGESGMDLVVPVLVLCAVFMGEQILSRHVDKVLLHSVIAGSLFVVLLAVCGLTMEGSFQGFMRNLVAVFAGTALSVTIKGRRGKRKKRNKLGYR